MSLESSEGLKLLVLRRGSTRRETSTFAGWKCHHHSSAKIGGAIRKSRKKRLSLSSKLSRGAYIESHIILPAVLGRVRRSFGNGRSDCRQAGRDRSGRQPTRTAGLPVRQPTRLRFRLRHFAADAGSGTRHGTFAHTVGTPGETARPPLRNPDNGRMARTGQMQINPYPPRRSGGPNLCSETPAASYLAVGRLVRPDLPSSAKRGDGTEIV